MPDVSFSRPSRSNASTGRAPVSHHATPAVPLRDLTDDELSEAMDADREQAEALLHAEARYCPTCRQNTLPNRAGVCLFCDSQTLSLPARSAGQEPPVSTGACTVPAGSRRAPGRAVGQRREPQGDHNEEERAA